MIAITFILHTYLKLNETHICKLYIHIGMLNTKLDDIKDSLHIFFIALCQVNLFILLET